MKTIDTPEFRKLLSKWYEFHNYGPASKAPDAMAALITHIDSHCAGVVEEAVEHERLLQRNADQLQACAVALPAGPIAGVCSFCNGAGGWGYGEDAEHCTACDGIPRVAAPEVDAAQRCDSPSCAPVPPEAPQQPKWNTGNDFLPFHPSASHVTPAYRQGWNDCYAKAQSVYATPPKAVGAVTLTDEQIIEVAARVASQSLSVTRMHELGGDTSTIMSEAGVIELSRAILKEAGHG